MQFTKKKKHIQPFRYENCFFFAIQIINVKYYTDFITIIKEVLQKIYISNYKLY